ncbi:hypothetical protein J5N97_006488 [Dioscorea zingiberensis]|uniref:SBP-type domain-containing protein n=1 Tax=Dioscorea zingiberensis TaxID=325984 RepID=A0A9D5DD62_9LILI|nr:hypothetical protein J5N97_006488 [Dioscorea zingiberensis]
MNMSSSSLAASLPCGSSNDSVNGLKFGMKIYFEDASGGNGGGGNSSKASSSSPAPTTAPAKKGKGVAQGVQQPPRCQVQGCNVDLSDAKAYYSRHKVCGIHSKSPKVIVAGLEQRFCQQCSRFHQLPEFDQGKRSCRRRLAGHNERRRKPPLGSLSSRIGRLSSSFHEDSSSGSRFRGFMMDFSHPHLRLTDSGRDEILTVRPGDDRLSGNRWQRGFNAPTCSGIAPHGYHPYMQGSAGGTLLFSGPEISPASASGSLAGVSDSSCALSLLSNHQQWSSNITRSPVLTTMSPAAQRESVMVSSCFVSNSWDFKGHETDGSIEGLQLQHSFMEPVKGHRFSSELELALQGNRVFGHSDDANINWPL